MCAASFFKCVVNIPRSLSCSWGRHVGGVISWGRNDRKTVNLVGYLACMQTFSLPNLEVYLPYLLLQMHLDSFEKMSNGTVI